MRGLSAEAGAPVASGGTGLDTTAEARLSHLTGQSLMVAMGPLTGQEAA